jgi:tRNA(fMet)-specific endonuclease VapC
MAERITLDTTFLIHLLRGLSAAVAKAKELNEHGYEACITSVNVFELYIGAYRSEKPIKARDVANLVTDLRILILGENEAKASAKIFTQLLAEGKAIDMRDALIAGTMLGHECDKIVTRNVGHFTHIKEIEVISY